MATLTAQILIGSPHPNHGGLNPTHYLFLSENSRPAFVLHGHSASGEDKSDAGTITWIPTIENMLEDALLMIAICVCKSPDIVELAKNFCPGIEADWIEVYSALEEPERKQLYLKCRNMSGFPKIIISVFRGSTIEGQLSELTQYGMDVEVCAPVYSREYSDWANETNVQGSLD